MKTETLTPPLQSILDTHIGRLAKVIHGPHRGACGKVVSRTLSEVELKLTCGRMPSHLRVFSIDIKFID